MANLPFSTFKQNDETYDVKDAKLNNDLAAKYMYVETIRGEANMPLTTGVVTDGLNKVYEYLKSVVDDLNPNAIIKPVSLDLRGYNDNNDTNVYYGNCNFLTYQHSFWSPNNFNSSFRNMNILGQNNDNEIIIRLWYFSNGFGSITETIIKPNSSPNLSIQKIEDNTNALTRLRVRFFYDLYEKIV